MTETHTENPAPKAKKRANAALFWMSVPVLLLVTSVSGWLVMVSVAVGDPGFSVEPDYYKKAAHFDDVLAQRKENRRLNYQVTLSEFRTLPSGQASATVVVVDSGGEPVKASKISAHAFPIARGTQGREVSFSGSESEKGHYQAHFEQARLGLWEFRVRVETTEGVYLSKLRGELQLERSGSPPS